MTDTMTAHGLSAETLDTLRAQIADAAIRPAHVPVPSARACTSPIHLTGESRTINATTGEVLRAFSSAELPGQIVEVACGNRRGTVCLACSKVYAADAYQLIAAGLIGGKGVPVDVADNPRVFATFTAPSFGPVHLGPGKDGAARRCHPRRDGSGCNRWHKTGDPAIGTPIDPAAYDYDGAVLWNASSSALWARFTITVRRVLARMLGLTNAEFAASAKVSYAKVAEYQKRGGVHFHAVIRIDGPDGPTSPAPAWATLTLLEDAIRSAAARCEVTTPDTDEAPSMRVVFGRQLDIRPIRSGELAKGELTDRAVAGYIAKYATKSADDSGALDRPVYCSTCRGVELDGRICRRCLGTGLAFDLDKLAVSEHIRTLIAAAWRLGGVPGLAVLKLRRWAHMLGFRGHFLTKARRYSTTFAVLREARREHARAETREYLAAFGLLDEEEDIETLVVGSWSYAGRAPVRMVAPAGAS